MGKDGITVKKRQENNLCQLILRPLLGKEHVRGGESVCCLAEDTGLPRGRGSLVSSGRLRGTPADRAVAFQEKSRPESRTETNKWAKQQDFKDGEFLPGDGSPALEGLRITWRAGKTDNQASPPQLLSRGSGWG